MSEICPNEQMEALVAAMQTEGGNDLAAIDALLAAFDADPRLHFLKGSVLAGQGKLIEAHGALSKAVEIAPDFAIARFQLGFFQLTSGESNAALKTWARLDGLPDGHYLKSFVMGLRHLIRDEFQDCIDTLREGIANNKENPPLNNDMELIIKQCVPLLNADDGNNSQGDDDDATSATSLLLNQYSSKN
ncbi:hypothetical protein [Fretibacter rubidus]|uniref:hypothetical protein n=1 Tax=Fretibacter rubidus TaxID=570162 RepID=UPI00352A81A5